MKQERSNPLAVKNAGRQRAMYHRLRKTGLLLSAISGALLALPVTFPPVVLTLVTLAGSLGGLLVSVARILWEPWQKGEAASGVNPAAVSPVQKKDVDKKPFAKRCFAKFFS